MDIAIQSLVLTFAAVQVFLVCNIRDNTFSDRNTSRYNMSEGVDCNQNFHFYRRID